MLTSMNRMYCGNCGVGKFEIYARAYSPKDGLFVQCANCCSVTKIEPEEVRLRLRWPDEDECPSDGILCFLREQKEETDA